MITGVDRHAGIGLLLLALCAPCCVSRRDLTSAREVLAAFMDARMARDQLRAGGYLTERGGACYARAGMSLTGASNQHFDRYEIVQIASVAGDSIAARVRITETHTGSTVHTESFVERIVLIEQEGNYLVDRAERVPDVR